MKNQIKIIGIVLLLAIGSSSCRKEDNIAVAPSSSQTDGSFTSGEWEVTSFKLSGLDHKDFYKGNLFVFEKGGTVIVKQTSPPVSGRWSTSKEESTEILKLDLGTRDPYSLLNSDRWVVTKKSSLVIEMYAKRGDDSEMSIQLTRKL